MDNIDVYRLIGFLFSASLFRLPCKSDYWSAALGPDVVIKNITRNRVDQLLRSLHFGNNALQTNFGEKHESLIELFNNRCSSVVEQEQNLSIDE